MIEHTIHKTPSITCPPRESMGMVLLGVDCWINRGRGRADEDGLQIHGVGEEVVPQVLNHLGSSGHEAQEDEDHHCLGDVVEPEHPGNESRKNNKKPNCEFGLHMSRHSCMTTDYRCECASKKVIVGTGRSFKWIKGFTTEKKTYWNQPHTCYR